MFLDSPTALSQLKGGKVRALAISSGQRLSMASDVPPEAFAAYAAGERERWSALIRAAGIEAN